MEESKYQENGIIKIALDAADKIFMDQKRVKMNFFTNGSERRLALLHSSSSESCHKCEECGEKRRGLAMRTIVEKPVQAREILNFDYTKASPIAFVPIMPCSDVGNPSSLVIGKAANEVGDRVIPLNHKLQLIVSLTVPESDYNRKLGIFQVRVEFLSATGKVIESSSHPCMLRFKSQPIRFVETIIKSAPLIAGFKSESQILDIKMDEITEGLEPTSYLKVMLEPRAEYMSGAGIPEIYESSLSL
ncbi:hypothetical protein JCGZ_20307 [Jatropha curcas]|uniref:Uncharacterized protein n=1 Tax=Jatropha curcas TaxID=180498 RepID=A0A067JW74_JATCU|nr:hypothetical protein JCGZ_20307 [Jatropha curcas]